MNALSQLAAAEQKKTNLYLDTEIHPKGVMIGPEFQRIGTEQDTIVVFADEEPLANFGHPCRYLLYHAANGNYIKTVPARFPPYLKMQPKSLVAFHQPTTFKATPISIQIPVLTRCPALIPNGNRYAILYSGMSDTRHLNDLEFCYRMLIDHYGFNGDNIFVLNYDGSLNTKDGKPGLWPGNNTAYRIQVTGKGDRADFQAVFNSLKTKIKLDDLLFIHTNNHGDNLGQGSFLCTYPNWGTYMATDFCTDLAVLPKYKSLLVMMEQCNSGGFNAYVVANSTAANTSIASAAIASQSSYASADGLWDSFAHDWIAAQFGQEPNGGALAHNADTNGDGVIEAVEAYNYANSVKNPSDSPNYSSSSTTADNIAFNQQYALWWFWCYILQPILEKYRPAGSDPGSEFFATVAGLTPKIQKLVLPQISRQVETLTKELTPKVEAAFAAAFKSGLK